MKHRLGIGLLAGTGLLVSLLLATRADAQREVFAWRGALAQDAPHTVAGNWFKEVELVDVNGDGWSDIYLVQKQAGINSGPNIDLLYLSSGKTNGGIVLGLDDLADLLASDFPPTSQPNAFRFRETAVAFPQSFITARGYDAELVDLNGDGNLDILRPDWGLLMVLWGDGSGSFPQTTDVFSFGGNPNASCPVSGNYDDIALANLASPGGRGTADDFLVAQWDTCGRNLLVENKTPRSELKGLMPDFEIHLSEPPELPAEHTHSVSLGDVNGDRFPDAVLANQIGGFPRTQIYFGTAQGFNFAASPLTLNQPSVRGLLTTVADVVDLDGDGDLDLYIAQPNTDEGLVGHGAYFNDGDSTPFSGPFKAGAPIANAAPQGLGAYDARYVDLNGDGRKEIVVVSINVCEPSSNPQSPCNTQTVYPTSLQVFSTLAGSNNVVDVTPDYVPGDAQGGIAVDLADLDNDGDQDMVLGGVRQDLPGPTSQFAAAHIFENQTMTVIRDRVIDRSMTFVGIEEVVAGTNVSIPAGRAVIFETDGSFAANPEKGGRILLQDGFHAAAGSSFVARTY